MSIGQRVIDILERRRDRLRKSQPGALGRFWRDGGNTLLYDLPVTTGGLIIDAGGYQGEWTAGMVARYGCRSQIFEPIPKFFEQCQNYFSNNSMVQVSKAALGGADRKSIFSLLDDGTSEHCNDGDAHHIECNVIDVAKVFLDTKASVSCFKLNIEGGEYEVLERLLETDKITLCESLLIQFHRQPAGYKERYKKIVTELHRTHVRTWCYEMVWEKWLLKS